MQTQPKDTLLKVSEVARRAQVSITTVKYYAREGLIEAACKTSPNMAYYAPECVERVQLIKTLQTEKFYPLAVIKRMLQGGAAGETELLETIGKADRDDFYEPVHFSAAVREAGLKGKEAEILVKAGLITPVLRGRVRTCRRGDVRMMALAKQRLDAGIPLEQTAQTFAMYDGHLRDATRRDIESLITAGMLSHPLRTEEITRMITVSDETLDGFIAARRYAYNAALGAEYLSTMESIFAALMRYGQRLHALLREAGCEKTDLTDEAVLCFSRLMRLEGRPIAESLAALSQADSVLGKPLLPTGDAALDTLRAALALGWQTFAPEEFGYDKARARRAFLACAADADLAKLALDALKS